MFNTVDTMCSIFTEQSDNDKNDAVRITIIDPCVASYTVLNIVLLIVLLKFYVILFFTLGHYGH